MKIPWAANFVYFFYITFAVQQINPALGNWLYNFNIDFFHKINNDWSNPFFDFLMPYIREAVIWTPLYVFLLLFVYQNFGKNMLYWLIASIILVTLTDLISARFIKEFFQIPRPCKDSFLDPVANLRINRCPGGYSFVSSHAMNHFGLAAFWIITLRKDVSWIRWLWVWAVAICYAQVYVGVHFPIDVIVGGMLGIFIGNILGHIFNSKFSLIPLYKQNQL